LQAERCQFVHSIEILYPWSGGAGNAAAQSHSGAPSGNTPARSKGMIGTSPSIRTTMLPGSEPGRSTANRCVPKARSTAAGPPLPSGKSKVEPS
jgi:hypothetical protein